MERLKFEFKMVAGDDKDKNIIIITYITTCDNKMYILPNEVQAAIHHEEVRKTEVYRKILNTLKKRHDTRRVWIGLTEELRKRYIDEGGNLTFRHQASEEKTESDDKKAIEDRILKEQNSVNDSEIKVAEIIESKEAGEPSTEIKAEKLRFEFVMVDGNDEYKNIVITKITTCDGERFIVPKELQPLRLHKYILETEYNRRVTNSLLKKNDRRNVWITLRNDALAYYKDLDGKIKIGNLYLQKNSNVEEKSTDSIRKYSPLISHSEDEAEKSKKIKIRNPELEYETFVETQPLDFKIEENVSNIVTAEVSSEILEGNKNDLLVENANIIYEDIRLLETQTITKECREDIRLLENQTQTKDCIEDIFGSSKNDAQSEHVELCNVGNRMKDIDNESERKNSNTEESSISNKTLKKDKKKRREKKDSENESKKEEKVCESYDNLEENEAGTGKTVSHKKNEKIDITEDISIKKKSLKKNKKKRLEQKENENEIMKEENVCESNENLEKNENLEENEIGTVKIVSHKKNEKMDIPEDISLKQKTLKNDKKKRREQKDNENDTKKQEKVCETSENLENNNTEIVKIVAHKRKEKKEQKKHIQLPVKKQGSGEKDTTEQTEIDLLVVEKKVEDVAERTLKTSKETLVEQADCIIAGDKKKKKDIKVEDKELKNVKGEKGVDMEKINDAQDTLKKLKDEEETFKREEEECIHKEETAEAAHVEQIRLKRELQESQLINLTVDRTESELYIDSLVKSSLEQQKMKHLQIEEDLMQTCVQEVKESKENLQNKKDTLKKNKSLLQNKLISVINDGQQPKDDIKNEIKYLQITYTTQIPKVAKIKKELSEILKILDETRENSEIEKKSWTEHMEIKRHLSAAKSRQIIELEDQIYNMDRVMFSLKKELNDSRTQINNYELINKLILYKKFDPHGFKRRKKSTKKRIRGG